MPQEVYSLSITYYLKASDLYLWINVKVRKHRKSEQYFKIVLEIINSYWDWFIY